MEVASLSPLSPIHCLCRKEARSLPKLSPTLLCTYKGFHIGCTMYKHGFLRSAHHYCVGDTDSWQRTINLIGNDSCYAAAQSSLLGNSRKHSSVPWRCYNFNDFCGPQYSYKYHIQNKFARDVVVRSELAATGSSGSGYSLFEFEMEPKIRGACFYAVTAFSAIFLFILMVVGHPFVILFDRHRRKYHHFIAKIWATLTVTPFYKISFEGLENLPPQDTPAVYVSNHQSFLDIYTLLTLGRSFKFISKTSIFLFPIIGWAMFLLGTIPLKRMDSRSQLDCLKRCMDLINKGASVFFFPEGTRSKDGKLGPFKKGAFSVAAKTKAPVVPITLVGTGQIMPAGRENIVNSGSVKVVIHKPIYGSDPTLLCEEARNTIASVMNYQD